MKKISLIPAYKPDEKLLSLVKKLVSFDYEVVIVSDGNDESYDKIFDKCKNNAHIISYAQNMGKGYALKEGLKYIRDNINEPYIIVTMDCDGQHTVIDANKVVDSSLNNPNALVLGKRIRNGNVPLRSRVGNSLTKSLYKMVTGYQIYDTQTGLRAFSNELINFLIDVEGSRYEYEMNVLLWCPKKKIEVIEVPISTIYIDNNSSSHFDIIKDSYRIYKTIFKFYFRKK